MIPEDFLEDLGLDDLERDTKDMTDKIVDLKLAKDDLTLDTIKDLETAAENTIDEWNGYLGDKLKNIFKKEE
jgi:cytidylate kinase